MSKTAKTEKKNSSRMPSQKAWELRLYVAGQTPKSVTAFANLKKICEQYIHGKYHIEVVDLLKNPTLAKGDQILAIPTLVRKLPYTDPENPGRPFQHRTRPGRFGSASNAVIKLHEARIH